MRNLILSLTLVILIHATSAFATPIEKACIDASSTIEAKLGCLDDVSFVLKSSDGVKVFDITIKQPVDHKNPARGTFLQRLALTHRGESEPVVLQTSGYQIFAVKDSALSYSFQTNQIQVEHRFFADSKPAALDWKKLDIEQSAADFHHITESFKQIYGKKWVGPGASKGGMTSIYHRYFYPDDLAGTVADVAPLSFTTKDPRYLDFVSDVGGDA
jgi:hypothetical protein